MKLISIPSQVNQQLLQLFASELQAKQKEERENLERGEAFALLHIDKDGS